MTNPVIENILERRSIRLYTGEPLTAEEIETLKKAAVAAPTARDLRNQYFHFITSPEVLDFWIKAIIDFMENSGNPNMLAMRKAKGDDLFYKAPLFVAISVDKENPSAKVDAGIAVENLALAAKSIGLDSCILGSAAIGFIKKGKELSELIKMPEGFEFATGIAIGRAAMDKEPHPLEYGKVIDI